MCSLCGALGQGPAWEQEGVSSGDARWLLRREAVATAEEVTRLLRDRRIKVTASPGFGFVIAFATGGAAMAASLGEVWHLLARRGIPISDPLA